MRQYVRFLVVVVFLFVAACGTQSNPGGPSPTDTPALTVAGDAPSVSTTTGGKTSRKLDSWPSLSFPPGDVCLQGFGPRIGIGVMNTGASMNTTSTFEVWYHPTANPKFGTKVGEGVIPRIAAGKYAVLWHDTAEPHGNYKFRGFQVDDHPGEGGFWSGTCIR